MEYKEIVEKTVRLRHELHRHPELSLREKETKGRLMSFLKENTSLEIVDRGGWFYALKRGSDRTKSGIAFRADMDALPMEEGISLPHASEHPGISHKCGHDGHSAALCGLALRLETRETDRDVILIFQQAEEIGKGGAECAELLKEKNAGEVYAFHNLGGYPEGSMVFRRGLTQPASEGLILKLRGKTSHASDPENGLNPAETAAELIRFAGEKTEELRGKTGEMVLCTVVGCRVGDGDFGISPGEGELRLTLRSGDELVMKELERAICSHAGETAPEGMSVETEICDYFPETRNSEECLTKAIRAAEGIGMQVVEMNQLWRASEDFGYYTKVCPGAMVYIGNGEKYPALHTTEYDFNDRILEKAVRLFESMLLI